MRNKTAGLNDSDKIFVTVALWIAAVSLFATSLTLPMLPNRVTIFYKPIDSDVEYFSKYNNLLIVLATVIPAAIILIAASLRKRNRLQHNFPSIMLFGIMLSVCMSGVTIYGIAQQFSASGSTKTLDGLTLAASICCFVLSILSSVIPMIINSQKETAYSPAVEKTFALLVRRWNFGAYGFLLTGAVCSFLTSGYAFIPLAAYAVFVAVFMIVTAKRKTVDTSAACKDTAENTQNDADDSRKVDG